MKIFIAIIFFFYNNLLFSMTYSDSTKWEIHPSFKYDALCFVNIMTGDEFYLTYYQDEYNKFKDRLDPEVSASLANLKKVIKEDNGNIVSAWLCLYYSAVDSETLIEMSNATQDLSELKSNFQKSPYYSDDSWSDFESLKGDLLTVFSWLDKIEFEKYWNENINSRISDTINSVRKKLDRYNIIGITEEHLGRKLSSDTITVYMLYYSRPHGIKITGTRFLTDIAWPFEILIRTASHEMMHPPFDLKNDSLLIEKLELLKSDEFLMDKVLNHDPSFGYNSFEGFIEEDCVQALDQIINEKLNIERDPRKRWKENDDGMHVFAVALYNIMKEDNYNSEKYIFRDYLIENINNGKLLNGNIKRIYNEFYPD
ncbi:MAG TPA: hypothetical protein PL089_09435 [Ignavibacteria bacterium]|nr:hypothetical protein [Ignavibacteria bacterium]